MISSCVLLGHFLEVGGSDGAGGGWWVAASGRAFLERRAFVELRLSALYTGDFTTVRGAHTGACSFCRGGSFTWHRAEHEGPLQPSETLRSPKSQMTHTHQARSPPECCQTSPGPTPGCYDHGDYARLPRHRFQRSAAAFLTVRFGKLSTD